MGTVKLDLDQPGVVELYEATELFADRCLRQRKSLALDDSDPLVDQVWTVEAAEELVAEFLDRPDGTHRSFDEKLRDQLSGASIEAVQLLTELTWLHVVISKSYKTETKRRIIRDVANIVGATPPGGVADAALERGLTSTGTSFNVRRPNQLWLLVRFALGWLQMPPQGNERLLSDPWAFRDFVFGLEGIADQTQRHALLHLIHPDTFEDCVSQYHKRNMVKALAEPDEMSDDEDRTLAAIRHRLAGEYGDQFSFYGEQVRPLWDAAGEVAHAPSDSPGAGADEGDIGDDPDCSAWLIRGSAGERVPEWLDEGVCAVYFEDSFPFPIEPGKSRDELREMSEEAGVDVTAGGFNNELGQVWRFVNAVSVGDYVVTVMGQDIYLGVVESETESRGGRVRRGTYRKVDWLNAGQPVRRSNVAPAVYSKLQDTAHPHQHHLGHRATSSSGPQGSSPARRSLSRADS